LHFTADQEYVVDNESLEEITTKGLD
jgi:hypothetical protein